MQNRDIGDRAHHAFGRITRTDTVEMKKKNQENQDYFQLGTKRLFSQEDFERLIGFVSSRLTALDRPDVVGDKAQKGKISRD